VNNAVQNFAIHRLILMILLLRDRTTKAGLKNRRTLALDNEEP
jgi:hypothetical protein